MTELVIITGYLGAGKTTTLTNVLKTVPAGVKVAVVINEFAAIGIYGKTVNHEGREVRELSNGCVCCSKNQELEDTLNFLKEKHNPDFILLETTGVASLEPLLRLSAKAGISVRSVVTLVDAYRLSNSSGFGKVSKKQLQLSSLAILNKTDMAPEKSVYFANCIKFLNPAISLITTSHGRVSFEEIRTASAQGFVASQVKRRSPATKLLAKLMPQLFIDESSRHIRKSGTGSVSFETSSKIDRQRFDSLIAGFGKGIFRAKGIINFSDSSPTQLFQYASGLLTIEPHEHQHDKSTIVVIGKLGLFGKFSMLAMLNRLRNGKKEVVNDTLANAKYLLKSL